MRLVDVSCKHRAGQRTYSNEQQRRYKRVCNKKKKKKGKYFKANNTLLDR